MRLYELSPHFDTTVPSYHLPPQQTPSDPQAIFSTLFAFFLYYALVLKYSTLFCICHFPIDLSLIFRENETIHDSNSKFL